jgi:hypothetical protein
MRPLICALLLCASSLSAQTPGEIYRDRTSGRKVQVVRVDSLRVHYIALDTSSVLKSTFKTSYVLVPPAPVDTVAPVPAPPAPAPTPQPPADTTNPVAAFAFANFENGTTAPLVDTNGSVTGNAYINVIADPTGQFGGKVSRISYTRSSTTASADVNHAMQLPNSTTGLGQTLYWHGCVLIPTPASNMMGAQRKLIYWQRQRNDGDAFFILKAEASVTVNGRPGQGLKIELPKLVTGNYVANVGLLEYDKRTCIEVGTTVDTAPSAGDGAITIWINGAQTWTRTGTFTLMRAGTAPYAKFLVGDQLQSSPVDKSILFDEVRYWDDVVFSRTRIGQ